jgi:hypothetical protein
MDDTYHEMTMLTISVLEYMGVAILVSGFEVTSVIRKRQDIKRYNCIRVYVLSHERGQSSTHS